MPTRSFRSIPTPREIPFVGSVHRRFRSPLDFFAERKRDFGDAARFRLFNERFILFSDPALINEVLVTKQHSFRKGKALEGARVFLGNSLLVSEGEEHTRQRRLIQPAFRSADAIAGYARTGGGKGAAVDRGAARGRGDRSRGGDEPADAGGRGRNAVRRGGRCGGARHRGVVDGGDREFQPDAFAALAISPPSADHGQPASEGGASATRHDNLPADFATPQSGGAATTATCSRCCSPPRTRRIRKSG